MKILKQIQLAVTLLYSIIKGGEGSLKFDDEVVFFVDGKLQNGQVNGFGGADRTTLNIKDYKTGKEWVVPRSEIRMPKGGFRTRGE